VLEGLTSQPLPLGAIYVCVGQLDLIGFKIESNWRLVVLSVMVHYKSWSWN